jgi:hypothetical protein
VKSHGGKGKHDGGGGGCVFYLCLRLGEKSLIINHYRTSPYNCAPVERRF